MTQIAKKISASLVARSRVERSANYKVRQLVINELFFLFVSPWLLIIPTHWLVHKLFPPAVSGGQFGIVSGGACVLIGCGLSLTAIVYLWQEGRGTPSLKAPTVQLVTCGPFRYCRNPIQLGAFFFVMGVGGMTSSLLTGIIAAFAGLLFGLAYIKLIEEKELAARYEGEYEEYKNMTPMFIPCRRVSANPGNRTSVADGSQDEA